MTREELDLLSRQLLSHWADAPLERAVLAVVAVTVLALTARGLARRRCSVVAGVLFVAAALAVLLFAWRPVDTLLAIMDTPYMVRIRWIIGALSGLVLLITVESIRTTHLQERYALLWVATALVLCVAALFPQVVTLFRAITGTEYATAVVAVAFSFLVLVAFHFSLSISATQSKQTRLAQRIALLEARLERCERSPRSPEPAPPDSGAGEGDAAP